MRRGLAIAGITACAASLAACDVILGLNDRTLETIDAANDATSDASACDGDFCACHPHDFCEDFDPYVQLQDLESRWQVPGFGTSIYQLGGTVNLDNGNVVQPPSRPNALATSVLLQPPLPPQGAGFIMGQVNASDAGSPVVGISITVQILVTHMDAALDAGSVFDSGLALFGGVLAVVNSTTKNGVGVTLSEQGAYVGYALDVLTTGTRLAQGKQFFNVNPVFPSYYPLQIIVAKRSSKALPNVQCTAGPVLTDPDASIPDASLPADPVVIVASTGLSPPACEVLSADLVDPGWLSSPVIILGSVATGQGLFSVSFDNFVLDFLRE